MLVFSILHTSHELGFGVILTFFFHINTLMGNPTSRALGVVGPPHTPGQSGTSSRVNYNVTTVPLSVCYGALNLLVRADEGPETPHRRPLFAVVAW